MFGTHLLAPEFVVEFTDLDISAPLDDATFNRVRELWLQHKVAVFRDQDLSDDDLVRFTERLGRLFVHVRAQFLSQERPEIMYVSNLKEQGKAMGALGNGELEWHTDQSYTRQPVFGTLLYAIEVPETGGDTYFADLSAAYECLPKALRERVNKLTAIYSAEKSTTSGRAPLTKEQRDRTPDTEHPLVRTHPYLHRKALYLSPSHIIEVNGLRQSEFEDFIGELSGWATQAPNVYRHKWRVGDVVMWDNTSVMHRRDDFPSEQRRLLKRTGFHLPKELGTPH